MGLGRARRGDRPSLEEFPTDLTGARKGDIRELAERFGVDFLRLQFTDILGINKNVEVPPQPVREGARRRDHVRRLLDRGVRADRGVGHAPQARSRRPSASCPTTRRAGGWRGSSATSTRPTARPSPAVRATRSSGRSPAPASSASTMMAGCEAEFFLFEKAPDGAPTTSTHDLAGYFDLGPMDKGEEIRRVIVGLPRARWGSRWRRRTTRWRPGQHEIDFRYADALVTADNLATFKFVVRNVANRYGFVASFMPKPIEGVNGSGMHTHQSLFRGKENAFFDAKAENQLSKVALQLHRGAAAARARLLRDHQPAGQQLQAAGAGLRGAGQRRLVDAQPLAAGAHSRPPGRRHPLRAPHARSRRPIPYLALAVQLAVGPRRHRAEAGVPRAGEPEHLPHEPTATGGSTGSTSCRATCTRRSSTSRRTTW